VLCSISVSAATTDDIITEDEVQLTIEKVIEIALKDNPSLAQMQARYQAVQQIPSQIGSLPDPNIHINAMNLPVNSFDREQEAMTQLQLGISQAFPFPGKLALKERAAEYEAAAVLENVDEIKLKLQQQVTSSWWQLHYLDRSLEIIDNNLNLLRQFVKIAQTKYKVGDGLQQDVLLAQLELSKILDQQIQVASLRRNQMATLNTLMGRDANKAILLAKPTEKTLPKIASSEILFEKAKERHPIFKRQGNLIDAAASRLDLAKKEYYPDFKLGMTYGNRSGDNPVMAGGGERDDFMSLMFSASVPLYAKKKQDKGVSQWKNEVAQREFSLQDANNSVSSDIVNISSEYERAQEQFKLFKTGIIPQARQTVDSMLAGYKVNEVDFLNLVRSQITLFNYEIRYWNALTQGKQSLAKLEEMIVGEDIYE